MSGCGRRRVRVGPVGSQGTNSRIKLSRPIDVILLFQVIAVLFIILLSAVTCACPLNLPQIILTHEKLQFVIVMVIWGVRKIAESHYLLRHFCPSTWSISAVTGLVFIKSDI